MKYKITQKFDLFFIVALFIMILLLVLSARAQKDESFTPDIVSSGGSFMLEKTVVAGGGNQAQQSALSSSGTAGQSIAGIKSNGGQFSLYGGFWTPEEFAPTAASVTGGGRVKTAAGKGIRNVKVTVTFSSGESRATVSGAGGYYQFLDLPAGETYIFSVTAKHYTFAQNTQIRNITDDTQDIDFIAAQNSLKRDLQMP
jgi:hypothetical protein